MAKGDTVFHTVPANETFEESAEVIFKKVRKVVKDCPSGPRKIVIDMTGHRVRGGGFDEDMMKLHRFLISDVGPFVNDIQTTMAHFRNKKPLRNDFPEGDPDLTQHLF